MGTKVGVETRNDVINVALHRQVRRQRFFSVNEVAVEERSFSGWLGQEIFLTDWIRFEAGLRGDALVYDVRHRLAPRSLNPGADPDFTGVPGAPR